MATIDQQFVEYIVKTLVNNPDDVKTERTIDEKGVLLSLEVNPEDVGRIIGRRGATAQSIRTLLRALGTKNDARYNLKIINNDDYWHWFSISYFMCLFFRYSTFMGSNYFNDNVCFSNILPYGDYSRALS